MEFTEGQKRRLLVASFGALMAAGFGFVFRAMVPELWGLEFHVTDSEVGQLFGAGIWPIAVMMILNSFLIDKIGYKASMLAACFFQ
ncbi:MAG: MFS transporter, partial [Candidatus Latescibacterota bacterium]|nr:MFS transporter [Candidatus Latescibacterota bacterium]